MSMFGDLPLLPASEIVAWRSQRSVDFGDKCVEPPILIALPSPSILCALELKIPVSAALRQTPPRVARSHLRFCSRRARSSDGVKRL